MNLTLSQFVYFLVILHNCVYLVLQHEWSYSFKLLDRHRYGTILTYIDLGIAVEAEEFHDIDALILI